MAGLHQVPVVRVRRVREAEVALNRLDESKKKKIKNSISEELKLQTHFSVGKPVCYRKRSFQKRAFFNI